MNFHSSWLTDKKPLPPFGKKLFYHLQTGSKPRNDIFLFIGVNAYRRAKLLSHRLWVLALPLGCLPQTYYWPVKDCSMLVFDQGSVSNQDIEQLAYVLLLSGALVVRVILHNKQLVVYRGD